MANSMGAVLTGLANGLSNVPQQLNDLAFQQQSRQQQLQAGSLANQTAALQLQQSQTAYTNEQQYQQDMMSAMQGGQSAPAQPSGQTAAAPMPAGGAAPSTPPGQNQSLPAPLRNNNPGALMGSNGQLMKFPTVQAGQQALDNNLASYGQKGINTVQDVISKWAPASAGNNVSAYVQDVASRLGVSPTEPLNMQDPKVRAALGRAIAIHENGRAAVDSSAQNARATQSQQPVQAANQAAQQPSPADQLAAREAAGVDTPVPVYAQAIQAQGQQIKMLQGVYAQAVQAGHPAVAMKVMGQINALQDQQLEMQTKGLAVQKAASTETASLAAGVKDQSSYNNFQTQIRNNPAMQQAMAGLNLSGDFDQDRNKLQTLADRSETLKEQQDYQIKKQEADIKARAEQRAQQKEDLPKLQQAQAVAQDAARQQSVATSGVPFTPSLAATAPIGTTPQQIQAAQKTVQTQNAAYDKANAPAVQGAKSVKDLAAQTYVAVANGTVKTGGLGPAFAESVAQHKGFGGGSYLLSAEQQEFDKNTALMVQQMQLLAGANGGARSASTAAMYNNFSRAKPNINLSPEANMVVAHGLYVGAAAQTQMNNFLDKYRQANPDATVQSGVAQWHRYEQAAGPTMIFDPASNTMVPNTVIIPTLEDGSPNPAYKNPDNFFRDGHF